MSSLKNKKNFFSFLKSTNYNLDQLKTKKPLKSKLKLEHKFKPKDKKGFLSFFKTKHYKLKKDYPEYFYLLKNSISSEKKLILSSEKYNKATHDYYKDYQEHIDNLVRLDKMFDGFDSFKKSFDIIFKEFKDNKKIKEQSLLLSNYNKNYKNNNHQPFYSPEDIIKFHLSQQIVYLLSNMYSEHERLLIKQVIIDNIKNKPVFNIITSDNKETNFITLPQTKYHINYEKTKTIFDQVIHNMRNKLDIVPDNDIDDTDDINSYKIKLNLKSIPLIKFKEFLPENQSYNQKSSLFSTINPNLIKSIKNKEKEIKYEEKIPVKKTVKLFSEKEKTNKKTNKKTKEKTKEKAKKISNEKAKEKTKKISNEKVKQKTKEIMDISIPIKDAILPVLKVNIPKKIDNLNPLQEGEKKEFPFKKDFKDFKKKEEPFQFKK